MRILIDTNVILDVLCDRKDFVDDALELFNCCESRLFDGYISALSVPNIVYIMRKQLSKERINSILNSLRSIFSVADLKESDLIQAAKFEFDDYEDAVQSACAARIMADYILTRNTKDFAKSPIPAISPSEFFKTHRE